MLGFARFHSSIASAAVLMAAALTLLPAARAQFNVPQAGTQVRDPAPLKPPPGAKVAIVEWEDMECPDCAHANPLLKEAAGNTTFHGSATTFPWRSTRGASPPR